MTNTQAIAEIADNYQTYARLSRFFGSTTPHGQRYVNKALACLDALAFAQNIVVVGEVTL